MNSRRGKFYVTLSVIETTEDEFRGILALLGFIPTRVEALYHEGAFEYIGISPLFDEVETGCLIPTYLIIIHKDDEDTLSVTVEKRDENEAPAPLVF